MAGEEDNKVRFEGRKVHRRYTRKWASGQMIITTVEDLPNLMTALVSQRNNMVDYIEQLHEIIDNVLAKNNCCDVPSCFTANCTSSHK